jgi:hypothetical protein
MSKYPAQIDNTVTLPTVVDNNTPVTGETVNRLRDAIIATEAELGIKPSGTFATVRARLDDMDARITAIQINNLGGDLTGTLSNAKVIGLGGRPFADIAPTVNQVIAWSGIAWVPSELENITINVLPTSVVLPNDVEFLSGDGYTAFSNPTRVGARAIDLALYPASWPDGRNRTMKFIANLEVTNSNVDGYVQLKDVTHNAVIFNSLLTTRSLSSVELSAIIEAGETDGYMRDDCCDLTIYEAQIFVTGGNGTTDQVICRNARIEFTYSSPILVSALVPLALPVDINFNVGTQLNGFTTPAGIGGRNLDMSKFPTALPDGRVRTVKFHTDIEISAPGVDGYIHLFDTTHNTVVTGTFFQFTNTIVNEVSATLTVGANAGNIRNDGVTRYEVRLWKTSGAPTDRAICNNARITITYA